ncbi:HAD-IIA family hydrolase [Spelaeicoccus albus]|uniref:HAD superfamily hydrolase (TIGR01457 family) n=1 Tax=Spelaeicoccus albus TaxID=1280376 RepID=A0A7Z0D5B5_9MICO|nr:HAD-IIA family hydrolase [Spelaeicoccus albus]NYI69099.1 HAD superfamily hydrolase (TIGR01457 family) [Spelaeicoccus albus]
MSRLVDGYDLVLCDLDGVLYAGPEPIPGAAETLSALAEAHIPVRYLTNNASRTPSAVAEQLAGFGIDASVDQIVTSAQVAARSLAQAHPAGSAVLVIGGQGLIDAVAEVGLAPVFSADDGPVAVVQGFDKKLGWEQLAEAAYAVRSGLPWTATNVDATLPTERGIAPGNGTLIDVVATATRQRPTVTGKPEPLMFHEAAREAGARHPLMVGDRLNTDIAGAVRAGVDSLLVLTGVDHPDGPDAFDDGERPTYIAESVSGLLQPALSPSDYFSDGQKGDGQ